MNHEERNRQIRKDFEALQRRGWKVDTICAFLSEKDYPTKLSPTRIFDIVYRDLPRIAQRRKDNKKNRK